MPSSTSLWIAGFRLFRHLGMSFGIIPFTNVGYNYSTSGWVNKNDKDKNKDKNKKDQNKDKNKDNKRKYESEKTKSGMG